MARMLGRLYPSHCPACHLPPGPDCPDRGRGRREAKLIERRQLRREIERELPARVVRR